MKKNFLILGTLITLMIFVASCSKSDPQPATATVNGKWSGTGQYGTGSGSPTYAFTVTFKVGGTVDIIGNNSTAIDNASGTWQMVQDSVQATYTYLGSSATYTLSGKIGAGTNIMTGTIGLGTATTGVGLFTITKE